MNISERAKLPIGAQQYIQDLEAQVKNLEQFTLLDPKTAKGPVQINTTLLAHIEESWRDLPVNSVIRFKLRHGGELKVIYDGGYVEAYSPNDNLVVLPKAANKVNLTLLDSWRTR